jgi:uncharacterized membrane protein
MGGNSTKITARQWITVAILCFVNLINYMDRFTIAGKCGASFLPCTIWHYTGIKGIPFLVNFPAVALVFTKSYIKSL